MSEAERSLITPRLRLVPIGPGNAADYWLVHNDGGGLSRTPIDYDWAQLYAFLPDERWAREAYENDRPFRAHAHWLEIGWALRRELWGQGYASEIGTTGLTYAFDVLGVRAVVSCTLRHNLRSRAVMERIGMRYAGEVFSRGTVEGDDNVRGDAPFAVCVMLAEHRRL